MPLEKTATRLWKRLTREERLAAASYVNTLWLQDPERWDALAKSPEWL